MYRIRSLSSCYMVFFIPLPLLPPYPLHIMYTCVCDSNYRIWMKLNENVV
jgi:hypothetical protein